MINYLNCDSHEVTPILRHWEHGDAKLKPLVLWNDLLSGIRKVPHVLLTCGRGYACVFPQDADSPIWIPDRLIGHHVSQDASPPTADA